MPAPTAPTGVLTASYLAALAAYVNDVEARIPLIVQKTIDSTPVNNSTTLVSDSELVFNLSVGTYWLFGRGLFSAAAVADFKPGFTGTATFTMDYSIFGFMAGAAFSANRFTAASTPQVDGAGAGVVDEFLLDGQIDVTVAGTFVFQYAQFAANASDARYHAKSRFSIQKIT